jgi:nucleotide-binding universal stress UspA family protein
MTVYQNTFKNLLFVYSPKALNTLQCAFRMTQGDRARLTIVDVASGLEEYRGFLPSDIAEQDLIDIISTERQKAIEDHLKSSGTAMSEMEIRIRFGKAAVEIIRDVMAFDHDLVIKTAVGGTGLSERLFGSTALKLIRKCPCPVWIAHPEAPATPQRVLAAIDPMPTTDRSYNLNREIIETANQIAQMGGGRLDVLHGWHLPGESRLTFGRTKISPDKLERMRAMAERVHRQKAADLLERMQSVISSANLHVVHGKPIEAVLSFAEREKSDLIVIGTADQSALAGMLLGSTAESVVEKSRTSVLAIKPQGFTSPIKPR